MFWTRPRTAEEGGHIAVVDLGFGDSGKGIVTARLCATKQFNLVVKANGGCQCAHNVALADGRHFTFSQFGSGTFSRTPTYLTKDFLVEPFALLREAQGLAEAGVDNPLNLMHVAWNALLITPYHWALNQWQEDQRGEGRHGSCGRGIGTTAHYALQRPELAPVIGDIHESRKLYPKLYELRQWAIDQGMPSDSLPLVPELYERYYQIADKINIVGTGQFLADFLYNRVVFEGSQGVLLDEDYGFHPHTTWSKTTDHNARETALRLAYSDVGSGSSSKVKTKVIGVTRAYTTRHGQGPFVSESDDVRIAEPYNDWGHYQGAWRQGHLDLYALRYAIAVCQGVDGIYVTHTDTVDKSVKWCESYEVDGEPYKLQALDPQDFDAREKQTESLFKARPVLTDAPKGFGAQNVAQALGRPLWGWGWGPQTDQGMFKSIGEWL